MTRFRSMVAGALVAGLFVSGAAFAQGPRAGGPGRPGPQAGRGMMGGVPLGALNLTESQQAMIRDIRQRGRDEAGDVQAGLREAQEAQRKAVNAFPSDEGLIRATTLALAEVQAEMAIHEARVQNEIFLALTPEQQAQLTTMLAERDQRMQQRPQPRRQNRQ